MDFDTLKAQGECCSCGGAMRDSLHANLVDMERPAPWQYPTSGNVLTGERGHAVAIVCDRCIDEQRVIERVIEFRGDEVVYHSLADLDAAQES